MRLSRRPLLRPGQLLLPLTRSQVSTIVTETGSDGLVRAVAADVPRFSGASRRLLIEGQRTNEFTRPVGVGTGGWTGISGGGGTAPTITADYPLIAAPDATFTAIRLQANAGASGFSGLERAGLTAGSVKSVWVYNLAGASVTLQISTAFTSVGVQTTVPPGVWTRVSMADSSVQHRVLALTQVAGNSQTVDLLVWGAQSEAGATFASSLMLPPSPAATSTRGSDLIRPTLASLLLSSAAHCTLLFDLVIPQTAPGGGNQTVLVVDDGSVNNRLGLHNPGGGATIVPFRTIGGSGASGSSAGTFTPGTPFRVAASIRAGRIAVSVAGGAVVAATGGPTGGLTHLRIGNDLVGTAALFGGLGSIDLLPAVPDGVLRALSAGAL